MKIALVSRYYNMHQGIPHDVVELAERFIKKHEVHVFTQTWEDVKSKEIIFHKVPAVAPKSFINELFFFYISGLMLRKYNFDIVNFHDPSWYKGGIFTCHAFPNAGINIIKEFNKKMDTGVKSYVFFPFVMLYPVSNYNMKSKHTKKIISVSSVMEREIINILGRDKKDIAVIPNGINPTKFNPEIRKKYRQTIMERHGLKEKDFTILFVGYYHLRKGLQFLLKAFPFIKSNNVKLMIVGNDTFGRSYIDSIIKENHLEDRIIFAGTQPKVYEYFAAGDLLALPTLYEPFGNVVLEAMACGLPSIVSKLAGVSDLIQDRENGLIVEDPTNSEEIAEKINQVVENKELYKKISANAYITATKYSWDQIAEETLSLFEETLTV